MEAKAGKSASMMRGRSTPADAQLEELLALKWDIKQRNIVPGALAHMFEAVRSAIAAKNWTLQNAGFSTLKHLLSRLTIQRMDNQIAFHGRDLCPVLLERLGDQREDIRAKAAEAFTGLWPALRDEVEHNVLKKALEGRNPKSKAMSMTWLANMAQIHDIRFRAYVPNMVACLEYADSGVREAAKLAIVSLFQGASVTAKTDLRKQLAEHNVRRSIADDLLQSVGLDPVETSSSSRPASRVETARRPASRMEPLKRPASRVETARRPASRMDSPKRPASRLDSPTRSSHASAPRVQPPRPASTPAPASSSRPLPSHESDLQPMTVASPREIDDLVRDMLPCFEGRETEQNWLLREKNIITLRRLTLGSAPHRFPEAFVGGVKALLDGSFKAVNSLRTTVSTNGCLFIQDLARCCGSQIDSMVEIIMQNMVKVCANMKKITAQNGNATVSVIIENVSYHIRLLQHVSNACQDKNVQLRLFGSGWLKTLLTRQAPYKSSMEHGGGLTLIIMSLKKGLSDANPGVREAMRGVYWFFVSIWPSRADEIVSTLDKKSRSLLDKHPDRPTAAMNDTVAPPRKGGSPKKTTTLEQSGKSSQAEQTGSTALRAAIAAQKKALAKPASTLSAAPIRPPTRTQKRNPLNENTAPSSNRGPIISSKKSIPAFKEAVENHHNGHGDVFDDLEIQHWNAHKVRIEDIEAEEPVMSDLKSTGDIAIPGRDFTDGHGIDDIEVRKNDVHRDDAISVEAQEKTIASSNDTGDAAGPEQRITDSDSALDTEFQQRNVHQSYTGDSADQLRNGQSGDAGDLEVWQKWAADNDQIGGVANQQKGVRSDDPGDLAVWQKWAANNDGISDVAVEQKGAYGDETGNAQVQEKGIADSHGAGDIQVQQSNAHIEFQNSDMPSKSSSGIEAQQTETRGNGTGATEVQHSGAPSDEPGGIEVQQSGAPSDEPGEIEVQQKNVQNDRAGDTEVQQSGAPSDEAGGIEGPQRDVQKDRADDTEIQQSGTPIDEPRGIEVQQKNAQNDHAGDTEVQQKSARNKSKSNGIVIKAIERIRNNTMDILGYRKLQGLMKRGDIFPEAGGYQEEMLCALVDELEKPPEATDLPFERSVDLKAQVLLTIRRMFAHSNLLGYFPRVLTAILSARKHYPAASHIVAGLYDTANDIVAACDTDVVEPVVELVSREERDETVTMGVWTLSNIMDRLLQEKTTIRQELVDKIGSLSARLLAAPNADVRRQVALLCQRLYAMVGNDSRFWEILGHPMESSRNLLVYYITRG
ncbi:hypothetical protein BDW42DRAFT_196406 [Aspergillus taichungensis]|uniref:TOG domain-containing protein n=1 Tax=Aspergillus taichungensis TaxID=482145 RepID=A0A2J5HKI9_9EURO|nr:hypothetical protein BDW42DRAFT_196406 [Aspergillus taichungensis]